MTSGGGGDQRSALPDFPVDPVTLDFIKHSLNAAFDFDETGQLRVTGADMTLAQLLEFLSGPSEYRIVEDDDGYGHGIETVCERVNPAYSRDDVIRALVQEVEQLRDRLARLVNAENRSHDAPGLTETLENSEDEDS